jgi:hypothetical protein
MRYPDSGASIARPLAMSAPVAVLEASPSQDVIPWQQVLV